MRDSPLERLSLDATANEENRKDSFDSLEGILTIGEIIAMTK
jgi:hypothetical protein